MPPEPRCYAQWMSDSSEEKPRASPLVSALLRDGTIVETLYNPDVNRTSFAVHRDGQTAEQGALDTADFGRVVPYSRDNNLLTHGVVLFPSATASYGSDDGLLTEIRAFIHRYADLSESFEEVCSYYVLLTWMYDAFAEVPYLRLKGDFGTGKSRCLQTIGSLCYKPMFVSGASTVSPMFRIIDAFRGTLVMDESDFRFSDEKAEIVKIWNNGNASGFPVLRSEATSTKEYNPRAFVVYGPKIIATRGDFQDQALESRCITEVMSGLPPRSDIPISLPGEFHTEARELRNKCLAYRFQNLPVARGLPRPRDSGIEARVAQIFGPLLSIVRSPEARSRILALARGKSGSLRADRNASTEAQLVGVLRELQTAGSPLGVKNIMERFSELFGAEYERPINARWIGAQLRRRLSLVPEKMHGVFVIQGNSDKLKALLQRYPADSSRDMGTLGISETPSLGMMEF